LGGLGLGPYCFYIDFGVFFGARLPKNHTRKRWFTTLWKCPSIPAITPVMRAFENQE
jgi:hypothetical protein